MVQCRRGTNDSRISSEVERTDTIEWRGDGLWCCQVFRLFPGDPALASQVYESALFVSVPCIQRCPIVQRGSR